MGQRILIIGITGGAGREVARAALAAGYAVRALHRNPGSLNIDPAIELVQGDAMNAEDVQRAAENCDFLLHGANPPKYRNWEKSVVQMAMNAANAAKAVNARLFIPGNTYNFGLDAFPVIREGAAQHPISSKGQVRVEMEAALKACGAKVTILRAGDFFGGHAPASWFQTVMVTPGKAVKKVTWPGTAAGHAFAYLPDLAQTFVRLMQEEQQMRRFEDLNFAGHHMTDGREFARAIADAAGLPERKIGSLPWAVIGLARPFVPMFREIWEMRYLWQHDAALDNTRLRALIGEEPHTPLPEAVRRSLEELGCLNADTPWSARSATLFSG